MNDTNNNLQRNQSKEKRFNKRLLGALVGGSLLGVSSIYSKRAKKIGAHTQVSKAKKIGKLGKIQRVQSRVNDGVEGFSQRIHKK